MFVDECDVNSTYLPYVFGDDVIVRLPLTSPYVNLCHEIYSLLTSC